eukprot:TRINITY_DN1095_c1_g1_i1.p1 TRINITY_DN1095_c1_g1~~TRINITY_DN1095_c1_g1_i1.p1  ORF type:complete len:230 (-),score=30.34 TRINITY_DN1095_c1_g1_i1:76-765(-)
MYLCAHCLAQNKVVVDKAMFQQLTTATPEGETRPTGKSFAAPARQPSSFASEPPSLENAYVSGLKTYCSQCKHELGNRRLKMVNDKSSFGTHNNSQFKTINRSSGTAEIKYNCLNCKAPNKAIIPVETADKLKRENKYVVPSIVICCCCCCLLAWTLGAVCGCTELGTTPPCIGDCNCTCNGDDIAECCRYCLEIANSNNNNNNANQASSGVAPAKVEAKDGEVAIAFS